MEYPELVIIDIEESKSEILIDAKKVVKASGYVITRTHGIFKSVGMYLDSEFDWVIGKDSLDVLVLLAMKKGD